MTDQPLMTAEQIAAVRSFDPDKMRAYSNAVRESVVAFAQALEDDADLDAEERAAIMLMATTSVMGAQSAKVLKVYIADLEARSAFFQNFIRDLTREAFRRDPEPKAETEQEVSG